MQPTSKLIIEASSIYVYRGVEAILKIGVALAPPGLYSMTIAATTALRGLIARSQAIDLEVACLPSNLQ